MITIVILSCSPLQLRAAGDVPIGAMHGLPVPTRSLGTHRVSGMSHRGAAASGGRHSVRQTLSSDLRRQAASVHIPNTHNAGACFPTVTLPPFTCSAAGKPRGHGSRGGWILLLGMEGALGDRAPR